MYALTKEVKCAASANRFKMLALFEGEAHRVLGYASWHAYCDVELGLEKTQAYRLVVAARLERALSPDVGNGELGLGQLEALSRLELEEAIALAPRVRGLPVRETKRLVETALRLRAQPQTGRDDLGGAGAGERSRLGEVYELGRNTWLMCADCTEPGHVDALMRGVHAAQVVVDPPYGVGRPGIRGDRRSELPLLYHGILRSLPVRDAVVAAFQNPANALAWVDAARSIGHRFERFLTLYRPGAEARPWRSWIPVSDQIVLSSVGRPLWPEPQAHRHDVYVKRGRAEEWLTGRHPAIKPLDVVRDIVSKLPQGAVFDPCAGSGTTLIAAAELGLPCFGMEIEPEYCDVARERFSRRFATAAAVSARPASSSAVGAAP